MPAYIRAMKVFSSHATANSPEIGSCGGASHGPKNGPTKAMAMSASPITAPNQDSGCSSVASRGHDRVVSSAAAAASGASRQNRSKPIRKEPASRMTPSASEGSPGGRARGSSSGSPIPWIRGRRTRG